MFQPPRVVVCGADAGGKHRDLLQFVRQRTDNVEARDRHQFADLLHGDLDFAVGAGLCGVPS